MQMVYTHTQKHFGEDTISEMACYYRDYLNNFLTKDRWADSMGFPREDAETILQVCKACHEAGF